MYRCTLLLMLFPLIHGCQSAPTDPPSAAAAAAGTTAPATPPATASSSSSSSAMTGGKAILVVYGMGCPMCSNNIDKQLMHVPCVQKVNVDLGTGNVTVAFKPDDPHPTRQKLAEAVRMSG